MTDDYYDDDPRDWDEEDGDDIDCGLLSDGQCLKAGSEECDWDCPTRNSERFVGSAAWRKTHSRKKPRTNEPELPLADIHSSTTGGTDG